MAARITAKNLVKRIVFFSVLSRPGSSFTTRNGATYKMSGFSSKTTAGFPGKSLFSTSSSSVEPQINHIGKEQMKEILDDYEKEEGSQYFVLDVRTEEEVHQTGQLSPSVPTVPVQVIMQYNVFQMDPDEFEELCGFEKPGLDETLVFTCAAGVRSVYACQFAAKAGYTNLVNYAGGSNEWFGS